MPLILLVLVTSTRWYKYLPKAILERYRVSEFVNTDPNYLKLNTLHSSHQLLIRLIIMVFKVIAWCNARLFFENFVESGFIFEAAL